MPIITEYNTFLIINHKWLFRDQTRFQGHGCCPSLLILILQLGTFKRFSKYVSRLSLWIILFILYNEEKKPSPVADPETSEGGGQETWNINMKHEILRSSEKKHIHPSWKNLFLHLRNIGYFGFQKVRVIFFLIFSALFPTEIDGQLAPREDILFFLLKMLSPHKLTCCPCFLCQSNSLCLAIRYFVFLFFFYIICKFR